MTESAIGEAHTLYSIGHSNHPLGRFLELLRQHAIAVVADVRSEPYSRYSPHFSRDALQEALQVAGVGYVFLGRELGGRLQGVEYRDPTGKVLDYGRRAEEADFISGLEQLKRGHTSHRIAMLCSEEDPAGCHRHRLVARALAERDVDVQHIRGDGRLQSFAELESPQQALFPELERATWKSTRSALRRRARPRSSGR